MPFQGIDLFTLKAQQKDLKAAESALLLQLADIQTRLKPVDRQIARIANGTTLLYSLPDEIIVAIIHIGHRTCHDFPTLVSHISHHMRELAIGSPTLWTRINIDSCLDQVKTYLSRSRQCLLTISMGGVKGTSYAYVEQLHHVLLHIDHWRSFTVWHGFENDEVLAHFSAVSAPRLESLDLGPMEIDTEIAPQLFVSAPMLSKVRLSSNVGFSLDSIMFLPATITSLELLCCSFSNCDHFYRFILTMPNLTNLKLRWLKIYSPFTSTHTTISLPSLVNLQISGYFEYLQNICELIAMPSLHHLKVFIPLAELHSFATWLNVITNVRGNPYPAIRCLEFDFGRNVDYDQDMAVEVMKKLIHGFPDVTHVLIQFVNKCNIALLMYLRDDTAWPHLDTLTIKDFYDAGEAAILSTLCFVIAARSTIRRLCLIVVGFFGGVEEDNSSDRTEIARLREHVHVEELSRCGDCDAVWDRMDGPWEHECEL